MAYTVAPETIVHRHPIRGVLWGTLLGIGITTQLVIYGLVPFGTWPVLAAPLAGAVFFGGLWGRFGPVKALKGRIPAALRDSTAARSNDDGPQARRAAQLAAARQAQADLQRFAQENADDAMCAALREAETDVLDSVSRRVGRVPGSRFSSAPASARAAHPSSPASGSRSAASTAETSAEAGPAPHPQEAAHSPIQHVAGQVVAAEPIPSATDHAPAQPVAPTTAEAPVEHVAPEAISPALVAEAAHAVATPAVIQSAAVPQSPVEAATIAHEPSHLTATPVNPAASSVEATATIAHEPSHLTATPVDPAATAALVSEPSHLTTTPVNPATASAGVAVPDELAQSIDAAMPTPALVSEPAAIAPAVAGGVVEASGLTPETAAVAASTPIEPFDDGTAPLERLADHPAAQAGRFDGDLASAAAALTAQLEAAWEID